MKAEGGILSMSGSPWCSEYVCNEAQLECCVEDVVSRRMKSDSPTLHEKSAGAAESSCSSSASYSAIKAFSSPSNLMLPCEKNLATN
jgi:hypothetical protein